MDEKDEIDPIKLMGHEQSLADFHQISERRYDSLDKRVKKLEMRGAILPDADEEHIIFYMVVFAIAANFILPAVMRLFGSAAEVE